MTRDTVTPLISACLPTVLPAMSRAGLSLGVLLQLQQCKPEQVPCLSQVLAGN